MASACFNLVLITLSLSHLAVGSFLCPNIDSIYQLGTSIADTGNLVRVLPVGLTIAAANPPYGRTFLGYPTGRWSDGRLIIDYVARGLGLPLLNPYLATNASFANGVKFAVAGATALDIPFLAMQGITVPPILTPLRGQQFQTYLNSSTIGSTPGGCATTLQRSLVIIGPFGGNDINYGLAQGRSLEKLRSLLPLITNVIINATREVIRLGAVRVVMPRNFPLGCYPTNLNRFMGSDPTAYDSQGCLARVNKLVMIQNNDLHRALDLLIKLEFPSIAIIYSDYYNSFQTVLRAGPLLGFDRTTLLKACCGNGTFGKCTGTATICSNPARYISWDGVHFTQEAYRRILNLLILEYRVKMQCFFSELWSLVSICNFVIRRIIARWSNEGNYE